MKKRQLSSRRITRGVATVLVVSSLLWIACSEESSRLTVPSADEPGTQVSGAISTLTSANLQRAVQVQDAHSQTLIAREDVVGTAIGTDASGSPVLLILTTRELGRGVLPTSLDGLPVVEEVTGVFRVSMGKVLNGDPQIPPIHLGTSGGWKYDEANGFCCSGTLGGLVEKGGTQYILSNYHVLENDIVVGGNGAVATDGDPVIQPGLADLACDESGAHAVAELEIHSALPGSNVDAAIAEVIAGQVDPSGAILGIGELSSDPLDAFVGQKVHKSGAATGVQKSRVVGLNGLIEVSYEDECAGNAAFTKVFSGQILVRNNGQKFFDFGDSGAMLVDLEGPEARAVGLLYALSSTLAAANPIDDVLNFFGATLVGN